MKDKAEEKRESPKGFFPKRAILVFAIVGVLCLVLLGIQELILRISGYDHDLYEEAPVEIRISGKVVDERTSEPVARAEVCVEGVELRYMTDETGAFSFALPAEKANVELLITVEKEGYEPVSSIRMEPSQAAGCEITLYLTPLQD